MQVAVQLQARLDVTHSSPKGKKSQNDGAAAVSETRPVTDKAHLPQGKDGRSKLINRQVTRAAEEGNLKSLLEVVATHMAQMNGINLATALHRVAKLATSPGSHAENFEKIKVDPRFVGLFRAISQHLSRHSFLWHHPDATDGAMLPVSKQLPGEMPVQCMSIVAWSCATLRIRDEQLFAMIASISVPHLDDLQPFELTNLLWAHAKLQIFVPDMFRKASERIMRRSGGQFTSACLSTIAWSFATIQWRDATVFASIAEDLAAYASEAKPQEISQTLWAFAKSRHHSQVLFDALGKAALVGSKIFQFKQQELSNTVWAFATTGMRNPELFAQIERAVLMKQVGMAPQSIANILWAFAKSQVGLHTAMFPALLDIALSKQGSFKPEEISAVMWAASQVCPQNARFFSAAQQVCVNRLREFTANAVANLVNTFSSVHTESPRLYVALVRESTRQLPSFGAQSLCNTLEGLAVARAGTVYTGGAEEINAAILHVCQEIASRITKFKSSEIQLFHDILRNHRVALGATAANLLDTAFSHESIGGKASAQQRIVDDGHSVGSLSTTCSHTEGENAAHGSPRERSDDGLVADAVFVGCQFEHVARFASTLNVDKEDVKAVGEPLGATLASLARGGRDSVAMPPGNLQQVHHGYRTIPSGSSKQSRSPDEEPWKVAIPANVPRMDPCWIAPWATKTTWPVQQQSNSFEP
jgi:hypothetical protein